MLKNVSKKEINNKFIGKIMIHKFKILTCFFIVSTLFFTYGMKKSTQYFNDENDQFSNQINKFKNTCICKKILEEETSIEEGITHAIDHNCAFCLNFHFSHNNWDVNHKLFPDENCWQTPLLYACQQGALESTRTIIAFNPEFTLHFSCGITWSAIHFAALSDHDTHEIIEILLTHNVNIDEQTKGDIKFLNLTQFNQVKKKFDFSCKPGTTALFIACFVGDVQRIMHLLKKGASIMHCLDNDENIFHSFADFLHAYSSKKIIAHDECLKIKSILNLLKNACDDICYTPQHLEILCLKDKKYRDTLLLILLIKNRPQSLLKLLPKLLLIQILFKFIKSTSTILLNMPNSTGEKTALQKINERLNID